jgi:hypothetical protein
LILEKEKKTTAFQDSYSVCKSNLILDTDW